jgi:RNA polymerase sigma-70 factor (ECF subfamily)
MDNSGTDAELVKAFNNGDAGALNCLIDRYKGPMYAYLLRLCGDRNAADDMFQEVFVKVIRKLSSYCEREKFSAWLFTVAHHTAMDHFRSASRRREDSLDAAPDDRLPLGDSLSSPEPGPDGVLEREERARAIQKVFNLLSAEQQEVFLLRHYSGLSFKEIAGIAGVPIGTVLARMSRAVAKMRAELAD